MKNTAKTPGWIQRRISGFTLTELLVAMTLSLFIIGGALSVFVSSQQTYKEKSELESAQEAVRYGAYIISRIVRLGDSISPKSSSEELVIVFGDLIGASDCLGDPIAVGNENIFTHSGDQLLCRNDSSEEPVPIADGLNAFSVLYPKDDNAMPIEYKSVDQGEVVGARAGAMRSVKVELSTSKGAVGFVISLRGRIISDFGGP
jgi:hypothetical protein